MLTADGWFDWAVRKPGPAWKTNGGTNPSTLFVGHSAGGFKGPFYDIMNGPARKSVQLFNPYQGPIEQLYPVTAQCWASGAGFPNNNGLAMETEGGAPGNEGEPMNPSQYANLIHVLVDWFRWPGRQGWENARAAYVEDTLAAYLPGALTEHKLWFPTECPSGRYPWSRVVNDVNLVLGHEPVMALGTTAAGIELRPNQQIVLWVGKVPVFSIGDPEGNFPGQIAKNMGPPEPGKPDEWYWLRRFSEHPIPGEPGNFDAYWSKDKGD